MSHLHKSKEYDLIDIFNDTSFYFNDIHLYKHIPDTELQLNKANTSDKNPSWV